MKKIAIHSVPRSGSTWISQIINSNPFTIFKYQPLFSYAFKDYLNENSSLKQINNFFNEIRNSDNNFITQLEAKKNGLIPSFEKSKNPTHVCYKEVRYHHILPNVLKKDVDIKVVGIIRNPFSVINSWLKALKEFKGELGWKIEEEWRYAPSKNQSRTEEFNGYEKWKEVALLFIELSKKFPEQFYLLEYDKILQNTRMQVKDFFSFCDLSMESQTLKFLDQSTQFDNPDPYSVFKIKTNDDNWETELPSFIIDEIKNDPEFKQLNEIFLWI